jgi:two-component system invasion response regulator UvrY
LQTDPVPVLIVDDQAPFRAVARTVVALTPGFEVAGEADSGEDAVSEARNIAPGLVLMDINLPAMNGIDATRQILAEAPDTVVILLSTYSSGDLPADAASCGAAAYVHKEDFSPDEVQRIWDARVGA